MATTPDQNLTETIHQALAQKDLLPQEHLVDEGYMDASGLVAAQQDHQVDRLGPVQVDHSWQAREGAGFEIACFRVNWSAHSVTRPQGHTSQKWLPTHDETGQEIIYVHFSPRDCQACSARSQCTRAQQRGRTLQLLPQARYEALQQARQRQQTPEFRQAYHHRAAIEGSLSAGTRAFGLRRSRFVGLVKTIPSDYPAGTHRTSH